MYFPVIKDSRKKLTDEQVRTIRDEYEKHGVSTYRLAKQYGVTQSIIWRCVSYISYQEVK